MNSSRIFLSISAFTFLSLMVLNYRHISQYAEWEFRHRRLANKHHDHSKVCREVFEIGKRTANMSKMIDLGVRVVNDYKKKKRFLRNYFYDIMGYVQPHMAVPTELGRGVSGSNVTVNKQWRFQQFNGQFPHLSCRLRDYKGQDVAQCARNRVEAGKSLHIMYIGDSRIRQHIEVLLDYIRDIKLIITTYRGEVLSVEDFLGQKGSKDWFKYKHDFRVESPEAPGFIIDFHWAAVIESDESGPKETIHDKWTEYRVGAVNLLKKLGRSPETLPDIILMNTGAWQLMDIKGNIIDQVDYTAVRVMQKMYPLLNRISKLTTVVWALPDIFKEFMVHDFSIRGNYIQQSNAILEWVMNGQAHLQPPGVLIWDSFLPISQATLADCMEFLSKKVDMKELPPYSIFKTEVSWHCTERMHIGFEALLIAAQMMVNHVCNPFMHEENYCCSG